MAQIPGNLLVGESPAILSQLALIQKIAPNKTNVLIIGESGTGKELVARTIHNLGPLKDKPFVAVNCGAIPENLMESEFFGHKRGSFTGAVSDKVGLFEAASSGTLFLDEVGELPLQMQVKLLRALQDRVVRKVGSNDDTKVDIRIIAATNRDLEAMIKRGTFREDLYYRLNVIKLETPPLRNRGDDILLLANHFLKKVSAKQKRTMSGFDPDVERLFQLYSWPGNVRELENVVERAVTLESGDRVTLATLPDPLQKAWEKTGIDAGQQTGSTRNVTANSIGTSTSSSGQVGDNFLGLSRPDFGKGPIDLDSVLAQVEKQYLLLALEHSRGVRKKVAQLLGITFRSMRYRLSKAGFDAGSEDEG